MVKYHLLVRPTLSGWPSIPRYVKTLIVFCAFIITWILVYHWIAIRQRSAKLFSIYTLQEETADMLNLELRYLPQENNSEDTWKETLIHHSHILSAYLDSRPELVVDQRHHDAPNETTWAMVRIIAILPIEMQGAPLTCFYKYRNSKGDNHPFIKERPATSVQPIAIAENFGMRYSAFFILCDLTLLKVSKLNFDDFLHADHLPTKIGVAPKGKSKLSLQDDDRFIPIHYPKNGISGTYSTDQFMSVCVPVLHHNFSRALNLIEFMEFYGMMGAERFTFYNDSASREVNQILDYYKKKGMAKVLTWKLPLYYIFERTLRVDGIFAALNDCLYRSAFYDGYKYVTAVDVDEFIVPRKHSDFREMMADLETEVLKRGANIAEFAFRNIFFYLIYEDDPITQSADIPPLYLQSKTRRVNFFNIHGDRSKYIVRGRDVVELGNHKVWAVRSIQTPSDKPFEWLPVGEDLAALHHYRYCETNIEACWLRKTVTDTTAHRFTKELGKRVAEVCKEVFEDGCRGLLDER